MEARLLHFFKDEGGEWRSYKPAGSGVYLSASQISTSPRSVLEYAGLDLGFWLALNSALRSKQVFAGW